MICQKISIGRGSVFTRPHGVIFHASSTEGSTRRSDSVAILARPEGRAQHSGRGSRPPIDEVAILARPEGRAQQQQLTAEELVVLGLRSSPDPKAAPSPP